MIVRSYSNIDIIQGRNKYGDATEGITDWRLENTTNGVLNILNSSSTTANISIIDNGNVGIGTIPISSSSKLEVFGDINSTGIYRKNNRDIIGDTSNYILTTSNLFVPRIIEDVGYGSNYVSRIATQLNTRVMNTSNYIATLSSGVGVGTSVSVNSQWTNVSSGIYYTPTPSIAITSSPSAATGVTGDYTYMVFTYTTETAGAGTGQSLYNITVPTGGVICDVLVVGGGGGGDQINAGGGGGGAVLYATNINIPASSYAIKVGKGGTQNVNGSSSEAFGAICLGGGSTPYVAWNTPNNGTAGGSGSGGSPGSWSQSTTGFGGGVGVSTKGTLLNSGTLYNGNIGGNGIPQISGTGNVSGGGGGGAGSAGLNSSVTQFSTRSSWISGGKPSGGGDGIQINITGSGYYWGAGGGGGGTSTHAGDGGLGGGGGGGITGSPAIAGLAGTSGINTGGNGNVNGAFMSDGGNGAPNTGSGGGGGGDGGSGGTGGSGIVIIRFLSSNRNVGIGTINPASELHVYDDTTINTKLTVQNNIAGNQDIVITPSSGFTNVIAKSGNPAKTYITYTFSFNQDNLIAYYKFNGNYNDSNPSTTKYDLTATGAPDFISTDTNFIQDSSVYLNASGEFLATSGNFPNTFGTSYSFWFKRNNNSTHDMLFAIGTDFFLVAHTVNKFYFSNTLGGNETYGQPSITWVNNTWYHCVFIFLTDGTWKIFINGVELPFTTLGGNYPFTAGNGKMPTGKLYIGGKNVGYWTAENLDGYIDEFYVFNKVLSSLEIINLYNRLYTVPTNTWNVKFPTSSAVVINGGSSQNVAGNYTVSVSNNSYVIPADGQAITPYPSTATTSVAIMNEYNRTLLPEVITTASGTTSRRIGDTDLCTFFTYTGAPATDQNTTYTFSTPEPYSCDILLVGGGGAGGNDRGGGGGGGGVIYSQNLVLNGTYTIQVGREGVGSTSGTTGGTGTRGTNGANTTISGNGLTITVVGGGAGGSCASGGIRDGQSGGSGGGGSQFNGAGSGGSGTTGQGASGGIGYEPGAGGGGGGVVNAGTVATSTNAGNGGLGLTNYITGSVVIYGSGGGGGGGFGGGGTNQVFGTGGSSGAGNGANMNTNGANATVYGCGGGGGGFANGSTTKGGNGGSGIFIIRYKRINSSSLELITAKQQPNEIVVLGTTSTTIGFTDRCILFPYTSDTITNSGQTQYTFTTTETLICDILVVGGGGSGGVYGGGGGGGDAIYISSSTLLAGTYTVNVGAGGVGVSGGGVGGVYIKGNNGYNTTITSSVSGFTTITACGGGGGGAYNIAPNAAPFISGVSSGGGGGGGNGAGATGNNLSGNGGSGNSSNAGGGGGAVGSGGSSTSILGGIGGTGLGCTITGGLVKYGGGGGGGSWTDAPYGVGVDGGGNGGFSNAPVVLPVAGTNGLGGGSGGAGGGQTSGRGGSGIVIIRYRRITGVQGYNIGNYNGDFKIVSSSYSSSTSTDIDFMRITKDGASIFNPTGTPMWSTMSDRRVKDNIERASYDKCYDNIKKMDLYRFSYIKELNNINKDLMQLGYIAQEVKDIFPKAVSTQEFHNENLSISDMLSIDISQINYTFYGAVKKLIEIDNNKEMRIKMIECLASNLDISELNNIVMDTSNIVVDTSNIVLDTSNIVVDTSNIVMDTSNIVVDTSNIVLDTSNIVVDTSNIVVDTSNIVVDTSNIVVDTSNIVVDTSNIVVDTSNISN